MLGDVSFVEKALRHDAAAVSRLRPAIAHGPFADLQAVDRFALDKIRQHAGGLAVAGLAALGRVDATDRAPFQSRIPW